MNSEMNENKAISLKVAGDLTVTVLPNLNHEFLISTKDVAAGYGVSECCIRRHKADHASELIEGNHYFSGVSIPHVAHSGSSKGLMWTKAGVIRLGFFIKSERAKLFRDWAEQLILAVVGHKQPTLPEVPKRKHNRLTPERIIDILGDVCLIENRELRERIANKITGGY